MRKEDILYAFGQYRKSCHLLSAQPGGDSPSSSPMWGWSAWWQVRNKETVSQDFPPSLFFFLNRPQAGDDSNAKLICV